MNYFDIRGDEDLPRVKSLIITSPRDLTAIIQDLPNMINLETLIIQNCGIDDDMMELHIAPAMKNLKKLKKIDFQGNNIGERGFKALISVIKHLLDVDDLELQRRYMLCQGGVMKSVCNHMSIYNLKELVRPIPIPEHSPLPKVRIGRDIYLKAGILSIRLMCLSEMNLGDEGAVILAGSFSIMVSMQTLYFYRSMVGAKGARAFAMNLPNARVLNDLYLNGNCIPPEYDEEWMNRLRQEIGMNLVNVHLSDQHYMPSLSLGSPRLGGGAGLGDPAAALRANTLREMPISHGMSIRDLFRFDLRQMKVDLSNQRRLNTDEEDEGIALRIPSMANETVIDFEREGRKCTTRGQCLIEAANEARLRLGKPRLDIRF